MYEIRKQPAILKLGQYTYICTHWQMTVNLVYFRHLPAFKYIPEIKPMRYRTATTKEVAVGDRIAYWIRTPQVRVQDPVGTVLSVDHPTDYYHNSIKLSIR